MCLANDSCMSLLCLLLIFCFLVVQKLECLQSPSMLRCSFSLNLLIFLMTSHTATDVTWAPVVVRVVGRILDFRTAGSTLAYRARPRIDAGNG